MFFWHFWLYMMQFIIILLLCSYLPAIQGLYYTRCNMHWMCLLQILMLTLCCPPAKYIWLHLCLCLLCYLLNKNNLPVNISTSSSSLSKLNWIVILLRHGSGDTIVVIYTSYFDTVIMYKRRVLMKFNLSGLHWYMYQLSIFYLSMFHL